MSTRIPWMASLLLAAAASVAPAHAQEMQSEPGNAPCADCATCGTASHWSLGSKIPHPTISWCPGKLCDFMMTKIDDAATCACNKAKKCCPSCIQERHNQPIPPQFMYNPWVRSPRDYFMEDH